MINVICFLFLIIISFALTAIYRKIAQKKSIVDKPNHRSSHDTPKPRGGGIIFAAMWFVLFFIMYRHGDMEMKVFWAFISAGILALVSLLDDIYDLSPRIRFVAQIVTVSFALYFLGDVYHINLGVIQFHNKYLILPILFIGFIWFINLYNFLDGIDGYAASEAIFVLLGYFVLTQDISLLYLIAPLLGFLIWNWEPSKIFMGDVGSTYLGFILAALAIYYSQTTNIPILSFLILSSLFWFDATYTLLRRLSNRETLSEAHKKHAYQRLVQSGYSHKHTVLVGMSINTLLMGLAFGAYKLPKFVLLFLIGAILINFSYTKWIDSKKSF